MKLNELITTSNGVFGHLDKISPLPWSDIVTPEELDMAFMFQNGNKLVSEAVLREFSKDGEDECLSLIASILSTLYANKWGQLYEAFQLNYPLNVVSRETLQENTNADTTNNVSAYDTDELVSDTGSVGKTDHTYTKDKVSLSAIRDNIELLQDTLIYDTVFTDVRNNMLLLVY